MRRRVQVAVVLFIVPLVGGVGGIAVSRVRQAASLMGCLNNLKQLSLALQNYDSTYQHFPTGTVSGTSLPPDERLGWLGDIWPAYVEAHPRLRLDRTKAWDADGNCPPYCFFRKDKHDRDSPMTREVIGDIKTLLCPANSARNGPLLPCPTHYVGLAGVGPDVASLPLSDHRAGIFGYDRRVSRADIKDGDSTTMALAEVTDGGPWTAGGGATIRGLVPGAPYLGEGGQVSSFHRGGDSFAWSPPVVTNVAFADGSVRRVTAAISPELFEALATIAGREEVEAIPEW
jgi:prepilin-type processing-associated H-X9-DG protein